MNLAVVEGKSILKGTCTVPGTDSFEVPRPTRASGGKVVKDFSNS